MTQCGKDGLHDGLLGGSQTEHLGEEKTLGTGSVISQLVEVLLVANAKIGTMLVDNHETTLDGGHDVTALVLVVDGGKVGEQGRRSRCRRGICEKGIVEVKLLGGLGSLGVMGGGAEGIVVCVVLHLRHVDTVTLRVEDGNVGTAHRVEIDGGDFAETANGVLDGSRKDLPDGLLVLELDFGLRGMDIYVDGGRVYVYIYKIRYARTLRDKPLVGLGHGLVEVRMAHIAAIDEEIFV